MRLSPILAAVVAFAAVAAFALSGWGAAFDRVVLLAVQAVTPAWLDVPLDVITLVGNGYIAGVLVLAAACAVWRRDPWHSAGLITGLVLIVLVEWALKLVIYHPGPAAFGLRPPSPLTLPFPVPVDLTNGYPSGHTARALYVISVLARVWLLRFPAHWISGAVTAVIGYGLVALGDHWPTEVVGGALLGWIAWRLLGSR